MATFFPLPRRGAAKADAPKPRKTIENTGVSGGGTPVFARVNRRLKTFKKILKII